MAEKQLHNRIATDYFTEVGQHELPSKAEEVRLFTAYAKARDLETLANTENRTKDAASFAAEKAAITGRIAEGYVRFVINQASKRTRDQDLLHDLICAGNVGLMVAIPKFDITRGFRFLTYAAWWISVHMQEHMNQVDAVHIPNHTRKEIRKRKKLEEAAVAAGLALPSIQIEEPIVGPLDPSAHIDPSCDTEAGLQAQERDMLQHMDAANLTRRERLTLLFYYGLREAKSHTFGDLSQLFFELDGSYLPIERIRHIKETALASLRNHLHEKKIFVSNDLL